MSANSLNNRGNEKNVFHCLKFQKGILIGNVLVNDLYIKRLTDKVTINKESLHFLYDMASEETKWYFVNVAPCWVQLAEPFMCFSDSQGFN